jgi:hypothetical protein
LLKSNSRLSLPDFLKQKTNGHESDGVTDNDKLEVANGGDKALIDQ